MTNQEKIQILMEALRLTTWKETLHGLPPMHVVSIWTDEEFKELRDALLTKIKSM